MYEFAGDGYEPYFSRIHTFKGGQGKENAETDVGNELSRNESLLI